MTKFILFSEPQEEVLQRLKSELFVKDDMKIAFMLSDGSHPNNAKYEKIWQDYIESNGAKAVKINNSLRGNDAENEGEKIKNSDAIILTGGNTFKFLHHLKESGLDKVIIEFAKSNKTIVGFSAGAIILSPTIEIAELPTLDDNLVDITDLTGLGLIDFDVYPHYEESEHNSIVDEYEKSTGRQIRRLSDDDLIVFNS